MKTFNYKFKEGVTYDITNVRQLLDQHEFGITIVKLWENRLYIDGDKVESFQYEETRINQ